MGTNKMAVPPTVSAAAAVPYENIHSGHKVGILKEVIEDSVNRVVMFVNEHDSKCLKTATSPVCESSSDPRISINKPPEKWNIFLG